jgi:hypothetical protein
MDRVNILNQEDKLINAFGQMGKYLLYWINDKII